MSTQPTATKGPAPSEPAGWYIHKLMTDRDTMRSSKQRAAYDCDRENKHHQKCWAGPGNDRPRQWLTESQDRASRMGYVTQPRPQGRDGQHHGVHPCPPTPPRMGGARYSTSIPGATSRRPRKQQDNMARGSWSAPSWQSGKQNKTPVNKGWRQVLDHNEASSLCKWTAANGQQRQQTAEFGN